MEIARDPPLDFGNLGKSLVKLTKNTKKGRAKFSLEFFLDPALKEKITYSLLKERRARRRRGHAHRVRGGVNLRTGLRDAVTSEQKANYCNRAM